MGQSRFERPDVDFQLVPVWIREVGGRSFIPVTFPHNARVSQAFAEIVEICPGNTEGEVV